jgi:decaprenylphospho-beta-D-ribofuranose 2-oxidase
MLFSAVIGGLGYVGAVLEVTYRLLEVPRNAYVETKFELVEGLERIAKSVRQPDVGRFTEFVSCFQKKILEPPHGKGHCPVATSAVVYMRGGAWGLVASSRYVEPKQLATSIFHTPNSFLHLLLQLLANIPFLRWIGYSLTFKLYRQPKVHVDKAFGYTFFEDGNRRLRRILHFLGVPGRILQQTFIIPAGPCRDATALDTFLKEADQYLDAQKLEAALIDVLYVDRDADSFLLSSSQELDGFAITFTFERLFRSLEAEKRALKHLSVLCSNQKGRVHLVKNVCADTEIIEKMYGGALIAMRRIRETNGAEAVLRNEFSRRVLPGIELEGRRA